MISLSKAFVLSLLTANVYAFAEPAVAPAENAKTAIGISSRDGFTLSGTDVLITRNGISEKLTKELTFPSGASIKPDGTLTGSDGTKVMLRPEQIVSLDGKISAPPVVESVAPSTIVQAPAAVAPAPAVTDGK